MTFDKNLALVCPALLLGVLATTGCKQPPLNCTTAHGYFAAKYELESGDASSPCGSLLGDELGLNTYFADAGMRPDLDKGSVAIRPLYLNNYVFRALDDGVDLTMDDNTQAVGDFTAALPDSNEFCEVPSTNRTTLAIPEVAAIEDDPETPDEDESVPAQPATTISYEWSNVNILVNADAQGTQMSAELDFEQDGCRASYHVTGVFPVVYCETNEDCDDDLNGINPNFATECLTELGMCVLSEEPPSYQ
ncbi:hypothetical protein [Paraliomyxa miuraensis]|uniref:hypothetical protein n=1 Tax=Paraliomyxa miuraensis TaxID=376150 RepID=UPI0022526F9E|nr:hypothetical protein [Paraliomyxa miuraensis]MCX4241617.1 hypothetical protein [Paraliomyxa miuraensis]